MLYEFWSKFYFNKVGNKSHFTSILKWHRNNTVIRKIDYYSLCFKPIPSPNCNCEECKSYKKMNKIVKGFRHGLKLNKPYWRQPLWKKLS